jgi:hypothetical protein
MHRSSLKRRHSTLSTGTALGIKTMRTLKTADKEGPCESKADASARINNDVWKHGATSPSLR